MTRNLIYFQAVQLLTRKPLAIKQSATQLIDDPQQSMTIRMVDSTVPDPFDQATGTSLPRRAMVPVRAESSWERLHLYAVVGLLATQAGLLGYSATRHSPTHLEPAFLVSGLSNWQLGRFELYCVNPPLVRMIAAIPVLVAGCETDWSALNDAPGARPEYVAGAAFLRANGPASVPLIIYARLACIPFSLIGAIYAYRWAFALYGPAAAITALTVYVFEPNLLAHGELITPDAACTSFEIVAGFYFWNWLRRPCWTNTLLSGGALGLAVLSKMSWLLLFPLWPFLWASWRCFPQPVTQLADASDIAARANAPSRVLKGGVQFAAIFLTAVYVINCAYSFHGTFRPLKDLVFVSQTLTGRDIAKTPGNRFKDTFVGFLPIPVPSDFLIGLDTQNADFEQYHRKSYLRGEWKIGGW